MAQEFFYQVMGETLGPLTARQLREAAKDGSIERDTLVRLGSGGEWVLASNIKGLFEETHAEAKHQVTESPPTQEPKHIAASPPPPPPTTRPDEPNPVEVDEQPSKEVKTKPNTFVRREYPLTNMLITLFVVVGIVSAMSSLVALAVVMQQPGATALAIGLFSSGLLLSLALFGTAAMLNIVIDVSLDTHEQKWLLQELTKAVENSDGDVE